ncbi:MAG: hypothetical protein AB9900_03230 [Humidesulfovibrio sp.]
MYEIEQDEPPKDFAVAWQCAGMHIQKMGQEGINWLRATLNPPLAEHLSFRLGNQLIFVFVDIDGFPFSGKRKQLFLNVSDEATAIPCVMRMQQRLAVFEPAHRGWGLVHANTGQEVDPASLVSDELIEMSNWELHDFSVQVVRDQLEKEGKNVFSSQSSLHIDPSIWFEDKGMPFWVVVRSGRYPQQQAPRPANLAEIKASCARMSPNGFFASVTAANANDPFTSDKGMPLYRGHGLYFRYEGLESV